MKDQRGGKQVMRVSSSENTLLVKVTQLFYAFSLFLVFVLFYSVLSCLCLGLTLPLQHHTLNLGVARLSRTISRPSNSPHREDHDDARRVCF